MLIYLALGLCIVIIDAMLFVSMLCISLLTRGLLYSIIAVRHVD